ncbi:4Fe-4S cluster-binding domain-containing protein [Embleya sp. NPDC059237]|uniref:4Fe-4S cluster-binding domain-containing protein n=1 Tax=Embleya sp. NPDC059237 TaxID=3346784 RepID=UPI003696C36F
MSGPVAEDESVGRLKLNRVHHPVTVLGHGTRAGIWVQGCALACAGCMSRDTWDERPESSVAVADVLSWVRGLPEPLHGVTVSGGEPLQQPSALAELLEGLREMSAARQEEFDLLVYSGHPWSKLAARAAYRAALAAADAVVAGPYVDRRNTGVALRGSDNQRVVPLTPLGRRRYGTDALASHTGPRLQTGVDGDGSVWIVGIPRRADLRRWEQSLRRAGVRWRGASWND